LDAVFYKGLAVPGTKIGLRQRGDRNRRYFS
jgi:hypothetical protein